MKHADGWALSGGVQLGQDGFSAGGSGVGSNGFTTESGGSKSVAISKKSAFTLELTSQEDTLNHDHDLFILWVNPEVKLTSNLNTWTLSETLGPVDGQPMRWVAVLASQLEGKEPMTNGQKIMLARLTPIDFQNILALDPALKGTSLASAKDRYDLIGTTVTVAGPSIGLTTTTEVSTDNNHTVTSVSSEASTIGDEAKIGFIDFFMSSHSVTWTYKTSSSNIAGQGEKITGSFGSSTQMENSVYDLYYDKVFKTFAFEKDPMSTGTVFIRRSDESRSSLPSRPPIFKAF
jgi:hypothetical protein